MSPPFGNREPSTKNGPNTVAASPPRLSMVHADHEHRHAQDVGQQDELLALVVGDVPGLGQEVDRVAHSSSVSRTSRERVQMPDEALYDLLEALRRAVAETVERPV